MEIVSAQHVVKDTSVVLEEVHITAPAKSENDIGTTLDYKVVNADDLTKNQGNTFINTLERIPGISAINVGVGISKPVIRGLSMNRVIVNEYGIKQEGQQWGADHGLEIDQFNVDRVEVIKGPVSVLYGSDGIGGVINIYPSKIPTTNSMNGDVLMSYKTNNDLLGTSIKVQANKNDLYTIARFTYQDYGSFRVPANEFTYNGYVLPIYNNRLKNTAGRELNFSILTGINRKWGFSRIYISNFNQHAGFFVGAFGVPRAYQLNDDGQPRKIDLPNQQINHFKLLSTTLLSFKENFVELDLGYQTNKRDEFSFPHAHGTADPAFGNLALGLNLMTFSASIKYTHVFNKNIKSIYGLSSQFQRNEKTGHEFLIPEYNSTNLGLFSFSELRCNNKFLVSWGLRMDAAWQNSEKFVRAIYDAQLHYIKHIQVSPALRRDYFSVSGSIGISQLLNENWKFKTNIGTAYRIPVVAELAANGVHHGTFRHEQGDSTLTPERGYMFDVGWYFKRRKFDIDFTPFLDYFDNYIYLSPSSKFSPLPDAGQIYQYKETKSIFWGFESSLHWNLTKYLSNEMGVEYVWNQNLVSSLPLPFTPPFSLLDEVKLSPFKASYVKNLAINITGHYVAPQLRVDRNEPETEGYFLVHLSLSNSFDLGKMKLSIFFQIRNIANAKYMNNMSRYRILNLPEQGRNFQIILKYSF